MPKPRDAQIFERSDLDWYVEPERCTEQLLTEEDFEGAIHDPCCGGGNILGALRAAGFDATGSDIEQRVHSLTAGWLGTQDFLADFSPRDNVVMNPPYFSGKGTEAFIRHAMKVVRFKTCVFVDRRFLTGKARANGLYREFPPTRVWEITPRPSCPPGEWLLEGNKAGGGTADYCWLVWDAPLSGEPTQLGWLRG